MSRSVLGKVFICLTLQLIVGNYIAHVTSEETTDHAKNLWNYIFTNSSYNKFIRPVLDFNTPVFVITSLNLVGILDVNVVEEKLTTTASVGLAWQDENFVWNPALFGGIRKLNVPQTEVWTPDMALDNGFTKMKALGDSFVLINVESDGTFYWEPYEIFQTKCTMDVEYFPFDMQICDINVGVWTSELTEVYVKLKRFEISLTDFQENSEWDLVGNSANSFVSTTHKSMIIFSISIRRKPQYYMYNVVAPILMLSLISVFTFAIPVESGEKLGFCMTVYLAFAVFLTIVSASLPVSSVQSLLGKYLIFLLAIGTLIVIISTLELRIHFRHKSRAIPSCVHGLVRFSFVLQCRTCGQRKVDQTPEKEIQVENGPEVETKTITWTDVSSAIDFFCFWVFLVAVIFGTVVVFMIGYNKSREEPDFTSSRNL